MNDTSIPQPEPDPPQRWHDHDCTRCGKHLGRGEPTFRIGNLQRYAPMQPRADYTPPEWEAIGDWTRDHSKHIAGVLCKVCASDLQGWAMEHRFRGLRGGA